MRSHTGVVVAAAFVRIVSACCAARASSPEGFRVLGVYSNCFDYKFTSVAGTRNGKTCLAFNHVDGRTFFVNVGDKMGEYTLKSFEVRNDREFDPSVGGYRNRESGAAILKSERGGDIELPLGRPASRPGLMARLVKLENGASAYVRQGDIFYCSPVPAQVLAVFTNSVNVVSEGKEYTLGAPSREEYDRLIALWAPPNPQEQETARMNPQDVSVQADAAAVPAPQQGAWPGRYAEVTFNPFEIVRAVPSSRRISAYAFNRAVGPDGKAGIRITEIPLHIPQFHVISYAGTVLVPLQ